MDFTEFLSELDPKGEWSDDGYGIDSCLVHNNCGSVIEQDCPQCPECHVPNPLAGLI